MPLYILKRSFELILTLFVVVAATFFLMRALPGGPFDAEESVSAEVIEQLNKQYGLDRPVFEQFTIYISRIVRGDFGNSLQFPDENINEVVASTLPTSFQLGLFSLTLALLFGIVIGLVAASRQGSVWDRLLMFCAGSGVALPSFLVAPLLVLVFSIHLGWLPPALWEGPEYWILPVVTLSIRPISIFARLVRSSALDVLSKDFITAARSRGATRNQVLFKHVLKNSLVPVIGLLGPMAAGVLSGSFVVEYIFAIPGLGKHTIDSVVARDYPMVMAMVILYTFLLTVMHWLSDLALRWVDPRVGAHEK